MRTNIHLVADNIVWIGNGLQGSSRMTHLASRLSASAISQVDDFPFNPGLIRGWRLTAIVAIQLEQILKALHFTLELIYKPE